MCLDPGAVRLRPPARHWPARPIGVIAAREHLQSSLERADSTGVTNSDLFVAAIEEARAFTPPECPTGGVDALLRCADGWPPVRLAQECVTLAAELSGASHSVLYACEGHTMTCIAMCPPSLESPLTAPQSIERFPWGVGTVMASRFVLVDDACALQASTADPAFTTLGELGFTSAVHLPLWAGNRLSGALHLYWDRCVASWDDRPGALLRAIGVFTLDRLARCDGAPVSTRRSQVAFGSADLL